MQNLSIFIVRKNTPVNQGKHFLCAFVKTILFIIYSTINPSTRPVVAAFLQSITRNRCNYPLVTYDICFY